MKKIIVSIDGPAVSVKQRIAKYIAKKYKFYHLDSGVLYRRITLLVIKKKVDLKNLKKIKEVINNIEYLSPRNHRNLRTEVVSKNASIISKILFVRKFVNNQQKLIVARKLKRRRGCVIDGRDIGSKVFTNAKYKLFVDVKAKIRANRRHKQLIELGEKSIYGKILKEIILRDKADINRKESPLIIPRNSIIIDNSSSFKNTTNQINKVLRKI